MINIQYHIHGYIGGKINSAAHEHMRTHIDISPQLNIWEQVGGIVWDSASINLVAVRTVVRKNIFTKIKQQ